MRANGRSYRFSRLRIVVAPGLGAFARLGLAVSRRYGSAVQRNHFKRLVREAFRAHRNELPNVDLLVMPLRDVPPPEFADVTSDFAELAARLQRDDRP